MVSSNLVDADVEWVQDEFMPRQRAAAPNRIRIKRLRNRLGKMENGQNYNLTPLNCQFVVAGADYVHIEHGDADDDEQAI